MNKEKREWEENGEIERRGREREKKNRKQEMERWKKGRTIKRKGREGEWRKVVEEEE